MSAVLVIATVGALYYASPRPGTLPARNANNNELTPTPASTLRIKPAISWPGGKSRYLDRILPLIPKHTCYVEPFAGGLAVLLAKPRSSLEVINDLNGDLINFYRCVRFHADVLLTELEFVLNSRQEFHDFRSQPGLTDIQRAARWFFRYFGSYLRALACSVWSTVCPCMFLVARVERVDPSLRVLFCSNPA